MMVGNVVSDMTGPPHVTGSVLLVKLGGGGTLILVDRVKPETFLIMNRCQSVCVLPRGHNSQKS